MPASPRRARAAAAVGALFTAAAVLLTGCGGDGTTGRTAAPTALGSPPDPGFGHVHGLGVNPGDGAVYAATHYGVFRLPTSDGDGAAEPVRIADRWQDTMGFTVADADLFYGSGHPDLREPGPPHLGLIVSRDRAETWQGVSLAGAADFHDLAVVGERIYGYDATSQQLLASGDGGQTWDKRAEAAIRDVTVDPGDPDTVLATTPDGVQVSTDAGAVFRRVPGAPQLLTVDWSTKVLAGADVSGTVWVASAARPDGRWQERGRLSGPPQAFTVAPDGRLLAADDKGVQVSEDGGRTWTLLAAYGGEQH